MIKQGPASMFLGEGGEGGEGAPPPMALGDGSFGDLQLRAVRDWIAQGGDDIVDVLGHGTVAHFHRLIAANVDFGKLAEKFAVPQ